ncbi:hypothetical protein [Paradesulfitobacterium ferrireducens]|uniref:hypothetical protein n=1 Tax=Paradesulfitobacterium ferrireducens TaxID=2816476 RepID=UPI001A902B8B|nr:hypothetical protein [Paradesulfitobacterium ferrireducens]
MKRIIVGITGCHSNSTSDVEMIQKDLPELKATTQVKDVYLDGGFYSSDVVKQAEDLGVKVHYTDMTVAASLHINCLTTPSAFKTSKKS